MKNNNFLIIAVVTILVGTVGFFVGVKCQQSKRSSFDRNRMGQGQFQGNRAGFRPVNGEIISSDEKSITVKIQDGSSRIVMLSEKTEINKAASGIKDDLKVGENVAVFGQENSDGSVTAQSIQLNPILRNITPPPK